MPRKNKHRAGKHGRQARGEAEASGDAALTTAEAAAEESTPDSSPHRGGDPQNLPAAQPRSTSPAPPQVPSITPVGIAGRYRAYGLNPSERELAAPGNPLISFSDPILVRAGLLVQFLMHKYKMKQRILKEDMLNIIDHDYEDQFADILKKAAERIEAVFVLDLTEVDSTSQRYELISKLKLPNNGRVRPGRGLPKSGLLMNILGIIVLMGNCAMEEDIWRLLGTIRVYAGRKHLIYGEPRKLITRDFVRLGYLEYRQVANSEPPRYEFLWGPKAHAETSKMKVLEFFAKINNVAPGAFVSHYEEAVKDEEERARARAAAQASTPPRRPPASNLVTLSSSKDPITQTQRRE